MPYLILFMASALIFGFTLHLRKQFQQTAHIRQRLQLARSNRTLNGMHYLRNSK